MNLHKIHAPRTSGRRGRGNHVHYFCMALAGLIMVLALSAGSAWSFEVQEAPAPGDASPQDPAENGFSRNSTTIPQAGSCLTLLKSLRETAQLSPAENYRHTAGSTAAFGLIIGLRFALAQPGNTRKKPAKDRKPQIGIWQMQNPDMDPRHALALQSYRQCQNRQVVKALSEFGTAP